MGNSLGIEKSSIFFTADGCFSLQHNSLRRKDATPCCFLQVVDESSDILGSNSSCSQMHIEKPSVIIIVEKKKDYYNTRHNLATDSEFIMAASKCK